jgi:hypothetical protein
MSHKKQTVTRVVDRGACNIYTFSWWCSLGTSNMHVIRQAVTLIVLATVGLPACLGVALHWGQTACCDDASTLASSCCRGFPLEHSPPVDRIVSLDDCLICDYLAIAKQFEAVDTPSVVTQRLPIPCGIAIIAFCSDGPSRCFLARGPPTVRSI